MRNHKFIFLIIPYITIALCSDFNCNSKDGVCSTQTEDHEILPKMKPYAFASRTAGPSGVLIEPKGGAVYENHVGNVGNVEVIYRGVSDGTNDFGARTCTIDLHLVPAQANQTIEKLPINNAAVIHLSYGLRPHDSGSNQPIWANFVPPPGACGDYHLLVYERQLYKDTVIHFQSAAPVIHFQCANKISPRLFPPDSISELE